MVAPADFFEALRSNGVDFYAGVPDSLLKSICAYIGDNAQAGHHVIAANEGAAVGLAIGHHLATGQLPLVYMQNSGLGNTINPLLSLVDPAVYGIPLLLLVGWRGQPGKKDEPQHAAQGRLTIPILETLEIPHFLVPESAERAHTAVADATRLAKSESRAVALVAAADCFGPHQGSQRRAQTASVSREDAIKRIVAQLAPRDIVVSTTGMASRELFEYREAREDGHARDFLVVGGMGHASQIALGIAQCSSPRRVVCLDGDGAALMHLGSLAIIGCSGLGNFRHIVLNNSAHDSVGGQPTVADEIDLAAIAKACNYVTVQRCADAASMDTAVRDCLAGEGPCFLELRVRCGSRKDLGRPTTTPRDNKEAFMEHLRD